MNVQPYQLEELILVKNTKHIESGIAFKFLDGRRLIVLPEAYPYILPVDGLIDSPRAFLPEYHLNRYRLERIAR
jgi:hypothetical protein